LTVSSDLHRTEEFPPQNNCAKTGRHHHIYYSFRIWEVVAATVAARDILLKMKALISETSPQHCGVPA